MLLKGLACSFATLCTLSIACARVQRPWCIVTRKSYVRSAGCLPVFVVMGCLPCCGFCGVIGVGCGAQVRPGCCGGRGARTYFDTSRPGGYCGGGSGASVGGVGGAAARVGDSAGWFVAAVSPVTEFRAATARLEALLDELAGYLPGVDLKHVDW